MWKFRLDSIEDLQQLSRELGVELDVAEDVSSLAKPVQIGGLTAPNSLAIHPMEGCDGDRMGRPGPLTLRRYDRFAGGGAGLIWAEAIAVVPEGRANPRQLWLYEKTKEEFASMVKLMRATASQRCGDGHRPVIIAQLTHSGRYSKPEGVAAPLIPRHDPYRDVMTPQVRPDKDAPKKLPADYPVVTDDYLDQLQQAYVTAAKLAIEAGFDGVDIKSCHGYLINELLAGHTREGKYGGSFDNRVRFLLEVVDRVREVLGPEVLITARLGIYDAIPYPYGWAVDKEDYTKPDLTEPKHLIGLLAERGVKLINTTLANPYYNPHCNRPFNQPIKGAYEEPEHPLAGVSRAIRLTGEVQRAYPDVAMVGTGYSWLRTLMPNVGAAVKQAGKATFIGAGRMAFAYPDFARDIIEKGKLDADKVCVGCSACTQLMRDGGMAGCVIRDNQVYGPIFKRGRMSDRENLQRLAQACLQCQQPTCQTACPAGIDIPEFIDLFLQGHDEQAYQTIRRANIFPEICAWLCPVEQQCQGSCLQRYIGDEALPIADIQRYLSEQANQKGWSKLAIPDKANGKRVAVIGAGPAGLACAAMLLEKGCSVTIFDKHQQFGGIVESAIPADRQESALQRELKAIFSDVPVDRLMLRLGVELDEQHNLDSILDEGFDVVFIGMGLPASVRTSTGTVEGVWGALEFLGMAKSDNALYLAGRKVAVIGGGNTAIDAAITARQLGAQDVYLIYRRSFAEMPAWSAERDRAMNKGIHFMILTQPVNYLQENGRLTAVSLCPTQLGEPDASGRRSPVPLKDSSYVLPMDMVVEAVGQQSAENLSVFLPGIDVKDGIIQTQANSFATNRKGVFAGGDIVRGAATVVAAVADGMKAAKQIAVFLKLDSQS